MHFHRKRHAGSSASQLTGEIPQPVNDKLNIFLFKPQAGQQRRKRHGDMTHKNNTNTNAGLSSGGFLRCSLLAGQLDIKCMHLKTVEKYTL